MGTPIFIFHFHWHNMNLTFVYYCYYTWKKKITWIFYLIQKNRIPSLQFLLCYYNWYQNFYFFLICLQFFLVSSKSFFPWEKIKDCAVYNITNCSFLFVSFFYNFLFFSCFPSSSPLFFFFLLFYNITNHLLACIVPSHNSQS